MVREERVELSTFGSGGRRSIQLSYSRRTRARLGQSPADSKQFCNICCRGEDYKKGGSDFRAAPNQPTNHA